MGLIHLKKEATPLKEIYTNTESLHVLGKFV